VGRSRGLTYRPRSSFTVTTLDTSGVTLADPFTQSGRNRSDLTYQASIALEWSFFDGLSTDSRIASAHANLTRARTTYDALSRNLASDIHQAVLSYQDAREYLRVTEDAVASAAENLNLTQQKYNVGSATILDLVDAQVQLETAYGDRVSALAAIRVAEAQIELVRGEAK
jgi:outer membrane protein